MKKYTYFIYFLWAYSCTNNFKCFYGWNIVVDNSLDTAGKEDVDSNGTIDATKNVTDDFKIGSIFATAVAANGRFGILGLDLIPLMLTSIKDQSHRKHRLQQLVENHHNLQVLTQLKVRLKHMTLYVQPGCGWRFNGLCNWWYC